MAVREVGEGCGHIRAGPPATARLDGQIQNRTPGKAERQWTLHLALCAACEADNAQLKDELREAVKRSDPFDVDEDRTARLFAARRQPDEAVAQLATPRNVHNAVEHPNLTPC